MTEQNKIKRDAYLKAVAARLLQQEPKLKLHEARRRAWDSWADHKALLDAGWGEICPDCPYQGIANFLYGECLYSPERQPGAPCPYEEGDEE